MPWHIFLPPDDGNVYFGQSNVLLPEYFSASSHIIVVGVCPHEDTLTPYEGIVRELTLEFSFAYRPHEFGEALGLLQSHSELAARLITSRQPLASIEAAFDSLAANPHEIKVLINPHA